MPGLTAYFGLLDIGQPKPGETVVVSGAAGAVGSIVGQIAKIKGCRAVGIAGERRQSSLPGRRARLRRRVQLQARPRTTSRSCNELCPKGIDVYFDNVGGAITDAVIPLLNTHARHVDLRADLAIQPGKARDRVRAGCGP